MEQSAVQRSAREDELVRAINAGLDEARVLVVEDDEAMRAFLEESLREEGYAVTTASNTLSAIVTLLGGQADVLVVDWKMPDLDGFEVCRRLKADPELEGVKVIMLTGATHPDDQQAGFAAGADNYLTKPFRPLELLKLVDNTTLEG